MRKHNLPIGLTLGTVTILAGIALAANPLQSDTGWFDFEGCAVCKNLGDAPGLLDHAYWENHAIRNGMMNIVTVEAGYAAAMATAVKKMAAVKKSIQTGKLNPEDIKMCGRCRTYGKLIQGDVNIEEVNGKVAIVTLVTSDDSGVVRQLHELARRDTEEMAQLKKHGAHLQ